MEQKHMDPRKRFRKITNRDKTQGEEKKINDDDLGLRESKEVIANLVFRNMRFFTIFFSLSLFSFLYKNLNIRKIKIN